MARCGWCGARGVKLKTINNGDSVLEGHVKPGSSSQQQCRGQEEQYAILIDKDGRSVLQ